jgi:uncharacterized protein
MNGIIAFEAQRIIATAVAFPTAKHIILAVLGGLLIGWIVATVMKSKLKSVEAQSSATSYLKKDSMKVTQSHERFLYRNVSKTKLQNDSSKNS